MDLKYVKVRYLDASVIVKIFYSVEIIESLCKHFSKNTGFCTTSLCLTEALSVLKSKWTNRHISEDEHFENTKKLLVHAWSGKLKIDEVKLLSIGGIKSVEVLARKHSLDWSDALQLETVIHGTYGHFSGESRTVLITADKGLAKAASEEGIRVWNCLKQEKPEWA